ncbi:MAG: hypothetical protein ACTHJ3_09680 [Pararhizobium sp.]
MKHLVSTYLAGMAAAAVAALPFAATPASAADPIAIGWVGPLSPPGN